MTMDQLLYTVPEACRILSMSRSKLYLTMDEGLLAFVHNGRRRLFHRDELERFAASLRKAA